MYKRESLKIILTCFIIFITLLKADLSMAFGETTISGVEYAMSLSSIRTQEYQIWKNQIWKRYGAGNSSLPAITVGKNDGSINFSWYSKQSGRENPTVQISKKRNMKNCKIFIGKKVPISRSNGSVQYKFANQVSVNYLKTDKVYYYRILSNTDGKTSTWSMPRKVYTGSKNRFSAILVSDVQIGASGQNGEGTIQDENISADTFQWERLLNQAVQKVPKAEAIFSMGDQINYKHPDETDTYGIRESEYAGFLFPAVLRNIPLAPVIGNHESKGSDFKFHFSVPYSKNGKGQTMSGCDYYFCREEVLTIVLNSNSRDMKAHAKLMNEAVKKHKNAKWRIVLMHHDIYGSGLLHSDTNSANLRILFAPLMDRFGIDVCFSGHDHAYTRSYFMFDGTAIQYGDKKAENPVGTLYVALGTASGSKFYPLSSEKQFYVAERTNQTIPSFSSLVIKKNRLQLKTYNMNGEKYADDYTIVKTKQKKSYLQYKKIELLHPIKKDLGASVLKKQYETKNDPLTYYGYAQGKWEDITVPKRLKTGFSTLLDKTTVKKWKISGKKLQKALQLRN